MAPFCSADRSAFHFPGQGGRGARRNADLRDCGGLALEARRIAMARALVDLAPSKLVDWFGRLAAYEAAGIAAPVDDADDASALRREQLRRTLFPLRLGAAA